MTHIFIADTETLRIKSFKIDREQQQMLGVPGQRVCHSAIRVWVPEPWVEVLSHPEVQGAYVLLQRWHSL